jgi:hypothetical protein
MEGVRGVVHSGIVAVSAADVTPKILHPLWDKVFKRTSAGSLLLVGTNGLLEKRACEIDEPITSPKCQPPLRIAMVKIESYVLFLNLDQSRATS